MENMQQAKLKHYNEGIFAQNPSSCLDRFKKGWYPS